MIAPLRFTRDAVENYHLLGVSRMISGTVSYGLSTGWAVHSWNLVHEGDSAYTAMILFIRPDVSPAKE